MKFLIILGDGMADLPLAALQGRTPLQAAKIPNMDMVAKQGRNGLAKTIPEGCPPGSDVANLSVMGYEPQKYYTGRAPLEAAAMGVLLAGDDIAFRCNFVTVEDGIMKDYSAGHISSQEGRELISALKPLMPAQRLYAGVSYRNLLVLKAGARAVCTPPHDITDRPIHDYLPCGLDAKLLIELMDKATPILASHPVNLKRAVEGKRPASMIWLWGQGTGPVMPTFQEKYGLSGAMISAVDLLKGIGTYAGLQVIDVPGATGTIDTNYEGKVQAALRALKRLDFVYLHIEAPDEAAHEGDLEQKIQAIEIFDQKVVGPMIQGLRRSGDDWRVLLMPDHATPISIKTHRRDPVPFAIMGKGIDPDDVERFDEEEAKRGGYGLVEGHMLMQKLLKMTDVNEFIYAVAEVQCFKKCKRLDSASGFFYQANEVYFITNRHVVVDEEKGYYPDEISLLLHTRDDKNKSGRFSMSLYNEKGEPIWLEHPTLGKNVDLVAIPLKNKEIGSKFFINAFSAENLVPPDVFISIGIDLLVIGYPLDLSDRIHNLPIVRNATLASAYPTPYEDKPDILIDARLHRGTSGSPVITKPNSIIRRGKDGRITWGDLGGRPESFLVGIHCETEESPERDPELDEPSGLNLVLFASMIQEIIEQKTESK